jgi:5-methylcytosine-specific restriction enzyme subunit McrC
MPDLKINESTFDRIVFNRKTQSYKKAIELSRLILLQYHPDLSNGRNHVLALMFDMNKLWEEFVLASLRKTKLPDITLSSQVPKFFWKPNIGNRSSIKPDIIINQNKPDCVVLDTKWKNLNKYNPSPEDLRQMYVYLDYYKAKKVALVYPGSSDKVTAGSFFPSANYLVMDRECSVIQLAVPEKQENGKSIVKIWQDEIMKKISGWRNEPS